jgi:membrane protease YdiL (CAAX protease family)
MEDLHPSTFRDVAWSWRDLLLGLAVLVAAFVGSYLILDLLTLADKSSNLLWISLGLGVLSQGLMLAYPLWVARRRGLSLRFPKLWTVPTEFLFALLSLVIVWGILIALLAVAVFVFGEDVMTSNPFERVAESPDRRHWLMLVTLALLVAPITEEVFFRGMVYNALRRRWPLPLAILAQAVLFSLSHPFALPQRVGIAVMSLGLAGLYEWRKTLLAPMFLHVMFNTLGLTALFWTTVWAANAPVFGVRPGAHERGCLIEEVVPGTAAEASGMKVGDVVTAIDGKPMTKPERLVRYVRTKQVGDKVSVDYLRAGEMHHVQVVLKARPK